EQTNPRPLLIKRLSAQANGGFAPVEAATWRICKDDALLESFGLPRYSTSPFRYLYNPESDGAKSFLATTEDAPANSHVQPADRVLNQPDGESVFNSHAGLIRVVRLAPLGLEEYLQVLEGRAWSAVAPNGAHLFQQSIYSELQRWSANQK